MGYLIIRWTIFLYQFFNKFFTLLLYNIFLSFSWHISNRWFFFQIFVISRSTKNLMKLNFWLEMYVPYILNEQAFVAIGKMILPRTRSKNLGKCQREIFLAPLYYNIHYDPRRRRRDRPSSSSSNFSKAAHSLLYKIDYRLDIFCHDLLLF